MAKQTHPARPHAQLPPKVPGRHRWVAVASWVLTDEAVKHAHDPTIPKFLDHETLTSFQVGCWDCELPLGQISPTSLCRAEGK